MQIFADKIRRRSASIMSLPRPVGIAIKKLMSD